MTSPVPTLSTILLVEDEAMLRATQARGLSKLPNVQVLLAGTVAEAIEVLMNSPPSLLVTDIDLPDRSGIELLGELGRLGLKIPVIFVSAYLTAYRSQIPPHANVEVLEKPIGIDELRDVVRRRLGVAVESTPFGVPDYLQLSALGRHSVTIEAEGEGGGGRIVVVQGEVWLAEDGKGAGFDAFARLAFCRGTSVRCVGLDTVPDTRQLSGSPESLLLEAARLADEAAAKQGPKSEFDELDLGDETDFGAVADRAAPAPPPSPPRAPTPVPVEPQAMHRSSPSPAPAGVPMSSDSLPPTPAFGVLREEGVEALLEHDYPKALRAFREALALKPGDKFIEANLTRLAQLGVT